jgi:hypothetical protein
MCCDTLRKIPSAFAPFRMGSGTHFMQVASGSPRRIWLSRFWTVSSVLMLAWTAAVPFLRA